MALDPDALALAQQANFAALTTLRPDGQPVTQIMWVDADADHLLINTEKHRRKFRNVMNDPRVTVAIWDAQNPYHFVEVRGRVVDTIGGSAAREQIDALSQKYEGRDYANKITSERVTLVIEPTSVAKHL